MSETYTDKVQTREVTNDKGVTKTFKSTGVDKKGKHFFTSSDGAKIKEYKTGKKPNIKTGIPVTKELANKLLGDPKEKKKKEKTKKTTAPKLGVLMNRRAKNLPKGDITKKMNMGGVMKNRGGMFKGTY
tara:strand:- start:476 stop:862 length:387 start_codon:yes stop_codon:yes gene_type:complete